jgi:hypothetical protein
MTLGDALTEDGPPESFDDGCSEEDSDQSKDDSDIVLAHFQDAGLLYTEEGEEKWVLFLTRTLNSTIKLKETRSDGIVITWSATPPLDEDIISVSEITSLRAGEMSLHNTTCSLFVPSPRPISQDSSKMKSELAPKGSENPGWLVISIPFAKDADEAPKIETGPVKLPK